MKKYNLLISIALITLFLVSCGNGLTADNTAAQNVAQDKAKIALNLGLSNSARNFYPDESDYDLTKFYNYTLKITDKAKPNEDPWTPIVNYTYSSAKGWSSEIDPGTYDFELIALKKSYNGSDVLSFSASCLDVKLRAGDNKELSFVLKPEETDLEGKLDLKFHFNNLRGTDDYNIDYIDLLLSPLWEQTELEETAFRIETDFSNTTDEILGIEKVLPQGLYKVQVDFYANQGKLLLDSYLFLGIGIESGFVTNVEETIKLNPIYDITFEDELDIIVEDNIKYSRMSPEISLPVYTNSSSSNYTFVGWYDASDSNKTIITSIPKGSTGNKTFIAKFEEKSFPVTFYYEKNGTDELEYETTKVNYYKSNNQAFLDEIASIDDEVFVLSTANKWYSDGITTEQIATLIENGQVSDIYYDRIYSINYTNDEDDATSTGTYVRSYTQHTPGFVLPVLSKQDYVFLGWYKTSDLDGSGATAVPKDGTSPITGISESRGDLELQAIWKNKTNSSFDIELVNDDDFDLSETYEISCTAIDTTQGKFKLSIQPLDSIEDKDAAMTALAEYTLQWIVDGDVIADETNYEFTLTTNTFTPDSIHNITVGATKNGITYTFSQKVQIPGQE